MTLNYLTLQQLFFIKKPHPENWMGLEDELQLWHHQMY